MPFEMKIVYCKQENAHVTVENLGFWSENIRFKVDIVYTTSDHKVRSS